MKVLEIAVLLGACILEKHFTHDKSLPGNDHYHAMDKEDLRRFWRNMERSLAAVGPLQVGAFPSEDPARRNARRSLVTARPVRAGARLTRDDLTWKRPAHGISPRHIDAVLGMTARADLEEDAVLQWRHLE
jgi:N-acetylneuraminate synthase